MVIDFSSALRIRLLSGELNLSVILKVTLQSAALLRQTETVYCEVRAYWLFLESYSNRIAVVLYEASRRAAKNQKIVNRELALSVTHVHCVQ